MKMQRTLVGLFVTIVGLTSIEGCNSDSTTPYSTTATKSSGTNANTAPNTIVLSNMTFGPSTLIIPKGTTVTFKNNDGILHTATSDSGDWDSGNISQGGTKTVTFSTVGTFPYHCTVHPMMTATIVVQ